MATGFQQTYQGLQIDKDPEANLTYTLDWVNWLPAGDSLSASTWVISTRANDPDPLLKVSNGIQGTKTYIRLNNGQDGKSYTVTVQITTVDGLIDRRYFRVKVGARSA
jgi:hypothetical protein